MLMLKVISKTSVRTLTIVRLLLIPLEVLLYQSSYLRPVYFSLLILNSGSSRGLRSVGQGTIFVWLEPS